MAETIDYIPENLDVINPGSLKPSFPISKVERYLIDNLIKSKERIPTSQRYKMIHNKVLDSPWSFHAPVYYKPFLNENKISEEKDVTATNSRLSTFQKDSIDGNHNIKYMKTVTNLYKASSEDGKNLYFQSAIANGFKSIVCDLRVSPSHELRSSHKSQSWKPRFTCPECDKKFSQPRNFKYHMSMHRGSKEFAGTCPVCGKHFNDRGYLSSHMKIHNNRKEYKCSVCPKSFNQRVAYNMHVRIHTGVKPHVCEECGKSFSRKMLLKQHRRTHSGERPYACTHCPKRFADKSNMTLHLRLHTGVKPFSCTLCSKSFTKKHHLNSHMNFHTGVKPYVCPRCSLHFTQSSNMRTHYKKCSAFSC